MAKNTPPPFISPLIDSHCHLTSERFDDDRKATLQRMRATGMTHAVLIGTGLADGRAALQLASTAPDLLSVSVGIDPFNSFHLGEHFPQALAELDQLFADEQLVAVGEIGLDYHYDLDPAAVQMDRLHQQLSLAEKYNKAVVIHVREAHADMISVLSEHPQCRGVIHSFTAGPAEAEQYLQLGWYLAFNGVMTFKNAPEVREAAKITPNDRLLIETDSPYLAPIPKRGKRCEPSFIAFTAQRLAEERGQRAEDIALWTAKNSCDLFALDPQLAIPLNQD